MAESEYILLRRFSVNGDAEAFAQIIKQHAPMVYGVCLRILANRERAADVVQDTFFQLIRDAAEITGSLPNWLHRVATHRAIDLVRSDSQRKQREMKYAANPGNIDSEDNKAAWREISVVIDEELENLDDQTKEVLILRFFEGLTTTEIAEKCNISQPTVSRWLESGIEFLRHKLKSRGVIVPAALLISMLTENIVQAAPASILKELGKLAIAGNKASIGSKIKAGISRGTAIKMKTLIASSAILIIVSSATLYYSFSQSEEPNIVQDTPSTSIANGQKDMELLKLVAQANKANYDSLVTWKSDIFEEMNSAEGDKSQIKTKVRYGFVFDQSQNAARWNKYESETTIIENGIKTVDPYYALITYTSEMYKDSVYYRYRGNKQPGTPVRFLYILSIEKDTTGSKRTHQSETDTVDPQVLLSPFSGESIHDELMRYYEIIKETDPNVYIYRKGDLVTLQFLRNDANDRYIFDISKRGNIVGRSNEGKTFRNTNKFTYEKKADSWVLKTYESNHYDTTWGMIRTSTRLLKFENSAVNEPIDEDEFTVDKLGIKQGDLVQDSRLPSIQYVYRGTLQETNP